MLKFRDVGGVYVPRRRAPVVRCSFIVVASRAAWERRRKSKKKNRILDKKSVITFLIHNVGRRGFVGNKWLVAHKGS